MPAPIGHSFKSLFFFASFASFALESIFSFADEANRYVETIKPLLENYCIKCHHSAKRSGGADFTRFADDKSALEAVQLWKRVEKRLVEKEMPPKGETQPTDEERKKIIEWASALKGVEPDCGQVPNEENVNFYRGYVMSRRINRSEYSNTIRDLLGVELNFTEFFPRDGSGGEGFDNNGDALFTSTLQIEKYLDAAELAIETALPERDRRMLPTVGRFLKRVFTLRWTRTQEEKMEGVRRARIFVAKPSLRTKPREAARQVVAAFTRRAFRRPANDEDTERLLKLYDDARKAGDSHECAIKFSLKGALVSPHFLFLTEPEPEEQGVYPLGPHQLASRLSYFLWSSMPDDELFALADTGKLREPDVLKVQVHRMLADPKARALGENFAAQWLGIVDLGGPSGPDRKRFPEFDDALADAMREETTLLFSQIIREDRNLLDLLNADYSFLNERLARHYGIEGVTGETMREVALADTNRGGLLGLGAILTATSHPLRTSPVLRGKWVVEAILGDKIPPPPPDAGTLPEDDVQPDGLTLRKRLEAHRTRAECAACHQKMDPIGFGLENFDSIGRWRTEQAGQPLDTVGELPTGEKFSSPSELKKILMDRKDKFVRHLSRKMLGYAMGRSLTQFDLCVVEDAAKKLEAGDYRASVLVEEIVLSFPFQHRYSKK